MRIRNILPLPLPVPAEAEAEVRNSYYMYHTGRQWKNPENYDLCLNTESLGLDHCVELIKKFVELKFWICSSEKEIL